MHDDDPHPDGLHEHQVQEQMAQGRGTFHHAAAQLDDRHLVAKTADPAEGFDQHVGILDRASFWVISGKGHASRILAVPAGGASGKLLIVNYLRGVSTCEGDASDGIV